MVEVKQATVEDLNLIMTIIDEARIIMRESGNLTQWSNGYPSREVIMNDIHNNHAFICLENEETVGYFCFIKGDDPEPSYNVIEDGKWLNHKPYGVIHRLASGRKVKGIAQKCFNFAFSAISNIKVDTHHENVPMQNYLKKNGFTYCGVIYVNDGTPRDAFQKEV